MAEPIIKVEHLSKRFIISHEGQERYSSLRDTITAKAKKVFSVGAKDVNASASKEEFWALKDLNFEINAGDRVGIIGRNGAGKSTLLKILSRITDPTEGRITINGRVASLLEVGTGFHPELTGRENIFLNGAILGMSRSEIRSKFDEIVAFAEVEKFLDTPVKRYSSGMYVRLAFAVAAHLEPEILIVDEVLAVGDGQFQKKCLGKMQEVSKNEGRTVLFVSHNIQAIERLCDTGIYLDQGAIVRRGEIDEVVREYFKQKRQNSHMVWQEQEAPGNDMVKVLSIRLLRDSSSFFIHEEISLEIRFKVYAEEIVLNHSIALFKSTDEYIFSSPSIADEKWFQKDHSQGIYSVICKIPEDFLNDGDYYINYFLVGKNFQVISQLEKVISFKLEDSGYSRGGYFGYWGGLTRPKLGWKTFKVDV